MMRPFLVASADSSGHTPLSSLIALSNLTRIRAVLHPR
jgi:hypothetical protein